MEQLAGKKAGAGGASVTRAVQGVVEEKVLKNEDMLKQLDQVLPFDLYKKEIKGDAEYITFPLFGGVRTCCSLLSPSPFPPPRPLPFLPSSLPSSSSNSHACADDGGEGNAEPTASPPRRSARRSSWGDSQGLRLVPHGHDPYQADDAGFFPPPKTLARGIGGGTLSASSSRLGLTSFLAGGLY